MPTTPATPRSLFLAVLPIAVGCGSPAAAPGTAAPPAPPAPRPDTAMNAAGPEGAATGVTSSATTPAPAPATAPAPAAPVAASPPSPCPGGTIFVRGGEFKPSWYPRKVQIPDLCVNTTETTAGQYAECAKVGACTTTKVDCAAQATFDKADTQDHPMVCVDIEQATAYCSFRHQRLPTAAEWEWAARGGSAGRAYPWGDEAPSDQLCWTGKHKQTGTCKVGSYPAGNTAHGVSDMAGNVFEFTTTENDLRTDVRIARGGSWRDGIPELVRNARVGSFGVTYRCGFLGIRCVQEPTMK